MTELDPKAVVIRYVNAVIDGDLDVIRESFAEDATWHYPGDLPLSRVWTGRDAIVDDFLIGSGSLFAPGGAPKVTLVSVLADGDRVVAEWEADGTAAGGGHYANRCLGVFTVAQGRITSVKEYLDTKHAGEVLFPQQG
ncbi:nuclear transport factor 2 family protein [Kitasatospora sp. RB6PN24]|uniref:nuclear transport factor 2 family protein n=1 Tax=Kitasatospora humi TaxID=2893891 RepID=UPI001E63A6E6|nr:nuclear transport factor 2 family protein [Kitasatospora humi]MCC9309426.1 nuclear transport factor 2 family protein [Kitasatospora humi]